jgi:putative acetyltransferase
MKPLYVRPAGRGQNLGRRLAEAVIACARAAHYESMVLDTLAPMRAAQALYASLGFRPTAPYYDNPLPDTRYLALDL